jgi:hypothetical protein
VHRRHERFLNISSGGNTFNLMARRGGTLAYKGPNWGGMFFCQYRKIFFKIRQKITNGLMAFYDRYSIDVFLASLR